MNFDVIDKIIAFYKKNCKISIKNNFQLLRLKIKSSVKKACLSYNIKQCFIVGNVNNWFKRWNKKLFLGVQTDNKKPLQEEQANDFSKLTRPF